MMVKIPNLPQKKKSSSKTQSTEIKELQAITLAELEAISKLCPPQATAKQCLAQAK